MKKSIKDFAVNIIASGIMTAALQIIVYPILARVYTAEDYGTILTVMGVCNTISATFGNALNNVRLVQHEKYYRSNTAGDFNILVGLACILSAIACGAFTWIVLGSMQISILIAFASLFAVIRLYYNVGFRLKMHFIKVMKCNCLTAIGYALGAFACTNNIPWPFAFLVGEIFGGLYNMVRSGLMQEPLKTTGFFVQTGKVYLYFMVSAFIGSLTVYLDRIFLYPLMGSEAVTTYTVASIAGKCLGIVMLPISGVLLSYYSQVGYRMDTAKYYKQCAVLCAFTGIFIIISVPIAPIFTKILYPLLYTSAKPYILIANIAAAVGVLANMFSPAVLRFAAAYWQVIITLAYALIYLISAIILTGVYGFWGFCAAVLIANIFKCIFLLILGKRFNVAN